MRPSTEWLQNHPAILGSVRRAGPRTQWEGWDWLYLPYQLGNQIHHSGTLAGRWILLSRGHGEGEQTLSPV